MEIRVNGVSIHYEKTGAAGPSMLLLHGNGEDSRIFDAIAPKLSETFTIYAIDSRNHGLSQKTGIYSYQTMSEDIHAFIKALNLDGAHIIGFSDGAIVGLTLAMQHGGIIGKMALLGINLKPEDFTEEAYQYVKSTYEETNDPLFKLMLEQPRIELDDIRHVSNPILVVAAGNDIYRQDTFQQLAEALPDAALKIMQGHDHGSYIINQDILLDDFLRFFR